MVENILWYNEVKDEAIPYIGEKAGCFAMLAVSGVPVPPGFILSSVLFEQFLHDSGLTPVIENKLAELDMNNDEELQNVAKEIQELILKTSVNMSILEDIFESYDALQIDPKVRGTKAEELVKAGRDPPFVSVRCSGGVSLDKNPFASYLHVKGKKTLIAAIKACWASFFTPRAIYHQIGDGNKPIRVSVMVQQMVTPDVSGVINIVGSTAIVQATYGIGLTLEDTKINVDKYKVDISSLELEKKDIGLKEWGYFYDFSQNENRLSVIAKSDQLVPCLSGYEIKKAVESSVKVHELIPALNEVSFSMSKGKVYLTSVRQSFHPKKEEEEEIEKNEPEAYRKEKSERYGKGTVILEGESICSGIAQGKVRVLNDLQDEDKVKPGEIILMNSGLADFTPAMCRAGAIIVEEEVPQDYIVRTARELRIPCVVGTKVAFEVLNEEDVVTVDARNGKVYRGDVLDKLLKREQKKWEDAAIPLVQAELLVSGLGVSQGAGKGKIKFVKEISDITRIDAGDVVVLRNWRKDFETVLDKSSAILIDSDEDIKSASKMFEYRKTPAVMGTDVALHKLKEGEFVTVDGKKGRVFRGNVDFS